MTAYSGKTILFVDDDPVVQLVYRRRLEQHGFIFKSAGDGLEAMRCLLQSIPDVVILDLMLPRMNGVEVFRFIRSDPRLRQVMVIVLSTNSIIDKDSDTLLHHAHRRLIKDHCTPDVILETIRNAMPSTPEIN